METTVLAGVFVTVLAGLVMGTSPWPIKLMRQFKYEHFAFISMLVALIIIPWAITLTFCPNAIAAFGEVDGAVILKSNLFSLAWGIAQVLALLCFVRIGVSLTYGILTALGASFGVITPMIFKASGLFKDAPDVTSRAGLTVLCGVAVMVVGVFFASRAGFGREKLQRTETKSGGFAIGLIMVVVAGILSAGWGFAFAYSQGPIIGALKDHGAPDIAANVGMWAVAFFGAALVNVLYPVYLMTKNNSWGILVGNGREIVLSIVYGILFFIPSLLLGKGMLLLGPLGASVGIGVQQSMQMLGAQGLGFVSGEWRAVTGKPRMHIYIAIVILVIAIVIMAFGNSFA